MDVLGSRVLIRPTDLALSQHFYREVLGLAVYREFGPPTSPGLVFHAGNGLIEVSGHGEVLPREGVGLWLQVRDVAAEHERLSALGVEIDRPPVLEPWGLIEMWLHDPDGLAIVLVEVPPEHPLRRDPR
jgi:catechol 2,3-dioxygenase-like lactoylglutathione lyase family enzyme